MNIKLIKNIYSSRIFKWGAYSLLILFGVYVLGMNLVIHEVLTPERLSALIQEETPTYLDAKVEVKQVKLSFFSSFPKIGVEIDSLLVVNEHYSQTTDTLLRVDRCSANMSLSSLLFKRVKLGKIYLERPYINVFVDASGRSNMDIIKEIEKCDTLNDKNDEDADFEYKIGKLEIKDGYVVFNDRSNRFYTRMKGVDIVLAGALLEACANLDMDMQVGDMLLWQGDKEFFKKLTWGINTKFEWNKPESTVHVDSGRISINGINFGISGDLKGDTLRKELGVQLNFGLAVPSLKELVAMVPASILNKDQRVKVEGDVRIAGSLEGVYGKNKFPIVTARMAIEGGQIDYEHVPSKVDLLEMDIDGKVDLNREKPSEVNIHHLKMKAGKTDFDVDGKIGSLLTNPEFYLHTKGHINLSDLNNVFPFQDSVLFSGILTSDVTCSATLSDLTTSNYGRLKMDGVLNVNDIRINIPQEHFECEWDKADCKFGRQVAEYNKNRLSGIIALDGLKINHDKRFHFELANTVLRFQSDQSKDSTLISRVESSIDIHSGLVSFADSVQVALHSLHLGGKLYPMPRDQRVPVLNLVGNVENLNINVLSQVMKAGKIQLNVTMERDAKNVKLWRRSGFLNLGGLNSYSPYFPTTISSSDLHLTMSPDEVYLDTTRLKVGNSDVAVSGTIRDFDNWLFNQQTLYLDFDIHSNTINVNQLVRLAMKGNKYKMQKMANDTLGIVTSRDKVDSLLLDTVSQVFVVPARVKGIFTTHVDRMKFGKLRMDSISGEISIANQELLLSGLRMTSSAAKLETSMLYRANNLDSAFTSFSMNMYDVDIDSLVRMLPALDTVFPMLRSFKGQVDYMMAGSTRLDNKSNIVLPSLTCSAHMEGKDLVLLDGETFSEIAKKLRFKNKKKNSIDSVSVSIGIKNGVINIYPFLIEIDRYRAAVGGVHNLDMSFNYHVSLLKSPLPFRAGVDITGTLDKMKYKITKAKYKDIFIPSRRGLVDSTRLNIHTQIKKELERIVARGNMRDTTKVSQEVSH